VGFALKRRAPEDENHHQVKERKRRANGKVPPVNQIALETDEEGVTVFRKRGHENQPMGNSGNQEKSKGKSEI
jgi:hypothetical protein